MQLRTVWPCVFISTAVRHQARSNLAVPCWCCEVWAAPGGGRGGEGRGGVGGGSGRVSDKHLLLQVQKQADLKKLAVIQILSDILHNPGSSLKDAAHMVVVDNAVKVPLPVPGLLHAVQHNGMRLLNEACYASIWSATQSISSIR